LSFSRYSKLTKIAFSTIKAFLKRAPGEYRVQILGRTTGRGRKILLGRSDHDANRGMARFPHEAEITGNLGGLLGQ